MAKTEYLRAVYVEAKPEPSIKFPCSLCEKEGKRAESTKYCTECFVYMCENCVRSKHDQFPLNTRHQMIEKDQFATDNQPKLKSFPTTRCKKHPGELINIFCRDHDVVCCSVCKAIDHGECVKTQHLPKAAEGILTSKEYLGLNDGIKILIADVDKILKRLDEENSCIANDRQRVEQTIAEFRRKVNLYLDDLERKTLDELRKKENFLAADIEGQKAYMAKVKQESKEVLDQLNSFKGENECELFVQVKVGKAIMNDVTEELVNIPGAVPKTLIRFEIDPEIERLFQSLTDLGSFSEVLPASSQSSKLSKDTRTSIESNTASSNLTPRAAPKRLTATSPGKFVISATPRQVLPRINSSSFVKYRPQFFGQFGVKEKSDTQTCNVSDICQLPGGNLVMTDYNNRKLKRFHAKSNKLLDSVQLAGQPFAVCVAGPDQVAVSMCNEKKIQLVSFGTKLELAQAFNVGNFCRGLVCIDDKIYVCCAGKYNVGCIKVFGVDGHMRQTIPRIPQCLPSAPRYMTVSSDGQHFFVSTLDNYSITMINLTGNVVNTFNDMDLKEPFGICTDGNEQVFVCGSYSNTVIQLSPKHKKIEVILKEEDKIRKPQAIYFDRERSRLMVSCSDQNELLVYKIPQEKRRARKK